MLKVLRKIIDRNADHSKKKLENIKMQKATVENSFPLRMN